MTSAEQQLIAANTANAELARQHLADIATLQAKLARGEQVTSVDLGGLTATAQQIHLTARSTATGIPARTSRGPVVASLPSPAPVTAEPALAAPADVYTSPYSQPVMIDASDTGSAGEHE